MIRSMTAFARVENQYDWGSAYWELRSVNNRYLDVSTRLPEDFRALESAVREQVSAHLGRGKVDCTLRVNFSSERSDAFALDMTLAKQLADAGQEVAEHLGAKANLDIMEILRWPGVFQSNPPDLELVSKALLESLEGALAELVATRTREGEKLSEMIKSRCIGSREAVSTLRERVPGILAAARQRLIERVTEIKESFDPERIEQEVVLLAQKSDVAEELDRLETHIDEVERVLTEKKPVGRRLDFLMQEMNREANTLGSKSNDADTTKASVELKVLIEQMREQIQNIE